MLSFTPPERLTDAEGRPYFLWDCDLTLAQFQQGLQDPDPEVRAYLVGKLMRQAKLTNGTCWWQPTTLPPETGTDTLMLGRESKRLLALLLK